MKRLLLILLLQPLVAAAAGLPDLPPTRQVETALRRHPLVRAAVAAVDAEIANRERLVAGPHEFALRLAAQQRRDRPAELDYREYEIGVERSLRLPGKAATDARLGDAGVEQARFALDEALHESARSLLAGWFGWRREADAVQEWTRQVDILQRQQDVVATRVGAGDAAAIEALLAGAQLAQAQAQLLQARNRRDRAAIDLAQGFPDVALPDAAVLAGSDPQPVDAAVEQWRELLVGSNHELAVARAAWRRSQLSAQRLAADRLPDPTVGIKFGSERDGDERSVGIQLTIPLPGQARAATARVGEAEAGIAAAREALVLARVEAEAQRNIGQAQGAYAQWQRLADVARRLDDGVRLLDRAWRLGEGQFGELQTARRQAIEARLAATQARLDAIEASYRLRLDAHQLWDVKLAATDAAAAR